MITRSCPYRSLLLLRRLQANVALLITMILSLILVKALHLGSLLLLLSVQVFSHAGKLAQAHWVLLFLLQVMHLAAFLIIRGRGRTCGGISIYINFVTRIS